MLCLMHKKLMSIQCHKGTLALNALVTALRDLIHGCFYACGFSCFTLSLLVLLKRWLVTLKIEYAIWITLFGEDGSRDGNRAERLDLALRFLFP